MEYAYKLILLMSLFHRVCFHYFHILRIYQFSASFSKDHLGWQKQTMHVSLN